MKKQGKAKAEAAKPDAADGKAAKVAANNGKKSGKSKAAAISDNATERELLREVVKGLCVIADRVESVRRTLWRIGEVRAYENKGAAADRKPETADGGEK